MLKSVLKKIIPQIIIEKTKGFRYFPQYVIGKYHKILKKQIKIYDKKFFFPEDINTLQSGV